MRYNGQRAIEAECDPNTELYEATPAKVMASIKDKIENIPLPDGYSMRWVGEQEVQGDAIGNLRGKVGQLGTLDEVLALCKVDRRITPCIDFGHLNARDGGWIRGKEQYAFILDRMAEALGDERASNFHAHFSRIEYTAGGEKRHLTFADTVFGPPFEPLLELLWQRRLAPVIVCESAGTQAEDAAAMKGYYQALAKG